MARAPVPEHWLAAVRAAVAHLPECHEEKAWTGVRWKVRGATVAHLFGGEDGLVRLTFRAEADEVATFEHLGDPYFRVGWGGDVVGVVLDERLDDAELRELLTDSYCVQAPQVLVDLVDRPPR